MKNLKNYCYLLLVLIMFCACTPTSLQEEAEIDNIENPLATGDEDETTDQTGKD